MKVFSKSLYLNTLQKTILSLMLPFSICFSLLLLVFILSFQNHERETTLQYSVTSQEDTMNMAISTIFSSLNDIQESTQALSWANAQNEQEYYYHAIKLFEELRTSTTKISSFEFEIYITTESENSFVITDVETVDYTRFFSDYYSGISLDEWQNALEHFENNNTPYTIPIYDNDDNLSVIYFVTRQFFNQTDLLYLVKIPAYVFSNDADEQQYALLDTKNQIVAFNNKSNENIAALNDAYVQLNINENNELLYQYDILAKDVYFSPIDVLGWKVMRIYGYNWSHIIPFIAFSLLCIVAFAFICIIVSNRLSKKLYSPIKETLLNIGDDIKTSAISDEFKLIRQNISLNSALNEQLNVAIGENKLLHKKNYYGELLFGIPDTECPLTSDEMSADYCVALIEFNLEGAVLENEWQLYLEKNYLYVYFQELFEQIPNYFINDSYNTSAVIFRTENQNIVEDILWDVQDKVNITIPIKISLSNVSSHVTSISDNYKAALHMMEYRYVVQNFDVITQDITKNISGSNYYYPLALENRLIQFILSGNQASITLYEEILYDNFETRKLPTEIHRNFIYAIITTLMRVFQELKKTPLELIGSDIDFQFMYENWQDKTIPDTIKTHIKNIVFVQIQFKSQKVDDAFYHDMKTYIYKHYNEDIMLIDIAEHFNISTSYCSTVFKRLSNDNFKVFLNNYRIEQAKLMIEKDPFIKVVDLSKKVGFNSSNSFIRVFKQSTGVTPKIFAEYFLKK